MVSGALTLPKGEKRNVILTVLCADSCFVWVAVTFSKLKGTEKKIGIPHF